MSKNYERGILTAVLIWLCLLASSHAQTPLPPAKSCFESSGVVLNGGKVFTYAQGTTTPLASYTDYTLGTPNANPVILGSDGCANIWLGPSAYKIAVQKSDGSAVYTTDGIKGGYNTFLALNGSNALTAISDPAASLGLFWLSSSNAGRIKWSDASGIHTVVGADTTDTLTNKALVSPTVTNPSTTGTDSGVQTLTNKTLTRPKVGGTAISAGNVALSAGWGSTATLSFLGGGASRDIAGSLLITAGGSGIAANPTITITLPDGTLGEVPIVLAQVVGATATADVVPILSDGSSATQIILVYSGTMTTGHVVRINYLAILP